MTKKKDEKTAPEEKAVPTEETEPTENAAEEKEEKTEEGAAEQTQEELKLLLAQTQDRFLRTLAEYDNFKKRTIKEKEELYFSAKADVIRKFLPLFDNFDRAALCTDETEFRKGVEMILQQFYHTLEEMEVVSVAKEGDEFDPVFHEAVFREEKEDVPENIITEVLQKGYAVGDKVIRHAMVKVSG